jgi:cob(I)alamin adenosyltransferase
VDAYGEVDELNACLGVARAAGPPADVASLIDSLQKTLFAAGARLADPSAKISSRVTKAVVTEADITMMEEAIDRFEQELPPLRAFVLPGGSPAGAALHLARTVCRRAERRAVALGDADPQVVVFLNRLSDLLFVMARIVNHRSGSTRRSGNPILHCVEHLTRQLLRHPLTNRPALHEHRAALGFDRHVPAIARDPLGSIVEGCC